MHIQQALQVGATGANITTSGTSAQANIPNATDGNVARYCYVVATAAAHIRWGKGNQTAVTTDLLLPANVPVLINTASADKIAAIQNASAGTVHITPTEFVR